MWPSGRRLGPKPTLQTSLLRAHEAATLPGYARASCAELTMKVDKHQQQAVGAGQAQSRPCRGACCMCTRRRPCQGACLCVLCSKSCQSQLRAVRT